jgi:hypothetical protein
MDQHDRNQGPLFQEAFPAFLAEFQSRPHPPLTIPEPQNAPPPEAPQHRLILGVAFGVLVAGLIGMLAWAQSAPPRADASETSAPPSAEPTSSPVTAVTHPIPPASTETRSNVVSNTRTRANRSPANQILAAPSIAAAPQTVLGTLSINAKPWADVWVDGQPVGMTPLANLRVAVGSHAILWRHPQLGERRQTIEVTADTPARIGMNFRERR